MHARVEGHVRGPDEMRVEPTPARALVVRGRELSGPGPGLWRGVRYAEAVEVGRWRGAERVRTAFKNVCR